MIDVQRPTASSGAQRPHHDATHEELLAARLPPTETEQPDPMMQLSVGRVGAGSVTLAALVGAVILAVVLYGLNSPAPNAGTPANAPPAAAAGASSPSPH